MSPTKEGDRALHRHTAGSYIRDQFSQKKQGTVCHFFFLSDVCWLVLAYCLAAGLGYAAAMPVVQDVRLRSDHRDTHVVIEVDSVVPYEIGRRSQPHRLFIDLPKTRLPQGWDRQSMQVDDGRLRTVRITQHQADQVRIVLDLQTDGDYFIFTLFNPYRIVVELQGRRVVSGPLGKSPQEAPLPPPRAALPSVPARPLVLVIDPGHGGKDPGAIGPAGLMEKTVTLQIAKALQQVIRKALPQVRVMLTRDTDVFLPLKQRAEIANKHEAQLFVSIHANSSPNQEASGIETWYLSFAANERAKKTAARENHMQEPQVSALETILRDLRQTDRINQSSRLAGLAQAALTQHMTEQYEGIIDRGVDGAPFVVLLHTSMPSILVEVSFMSNPRDEKRLQSPTYQRSLAQGIFRGLHKYLQATLVAAQ
jgi:N-acetylmuramoyl-L-alanine amidase